MNQMSTMIMAVLAMLCVSSHAFVVSSLPSIVPPHMTTKTKTSTSLSSSKEGEEEPAPLSFSMAGIQTVAVAGATGRTGSLVVEELVKRNVNVVALVRNVEKAKEQLPYEDSQVKIVQCDLGKENQIQDALVGCDAAIWCATGFSDRPGQSFFDQIQKLLGIALAPKQSIDSIGVPALGRAFLSSMDETTSTTEQNTAVPKVVMLSSAGVTRPSWDDEKKALFPGAADIPIVRLNPFGILDVKKDSEEKLRQTGVDYCIVRPCGLNDKWPINSRPIFSQGDVAVGRINRKDVATLLVNTLTAPAAVGKTFEAVTLAGYPPARSIDVALSKLRPDSMGIPSNEDLSISYGFMQQLLPGEAQDSAGLAMGQTYEELDQGKTGRLGKRGEENAEAAAPKPSS